MKERRNRSMDIAIVDDMLSECSKLKSRLSDLLHQHSVQAVIHEFADGGSFLEADQKNPFHLVFLDIYMDGLNGIEIASKLRSMERKCLLVFTTSSEDFALESYRLRAFHYLVKPYSDRELQQLFLEILQQLPEQDRYIEVKTTTGQVCILLKDIVYADFHQHNICVHKEDGSCVFSRTSFSEFSALFKEEEDFLLCRKGLLINLAFAEDYDGQSFFLKGGEKIPVSRSMTKTAHRAFADYLFRHNK